MALVFELALGRVPEADAALASQPTLSRFEQRRHADLLSVSNALCDLWCRCEVVRPMVCHKYVKPRIEGVHERQGHDAAIAKSEGITSTAKRVERGLDVILLIQCVVFAIYANVATLIVVQAIAVWRVFHANLSICAST